MSDGPITKLIPGGRGFLMTVGGKVEYFPPNRVDADVSGTRWPRPIPVAERLPEFEKIVLAWFANDSEWRMAVRSEALADRNAANGTEYSEWCHADFYEGDGFDTCTSAKSISHWLPLPPAPESA